MSNDCSNVRVRYVVVSPWTIARAVTGPASMRSWMPNVRDWIIAAPPAIVLMKTNSTSIVGAL
jgi:hypothetical protein